LVIIGEGPEEKNLKKMAAKNIIFLPWQSKEKLKEYYSDCRALIFPGEEDFGIVPVEAQACGKPVIAYAKGGAKETVEGILVSEETQKLPKSAGQKLSGLFFYPQTKEALLEAVKSFQKMEFEPTFIRKNSLKFDQKLFKEKISKYISEKLKEHQKNFSYR
jgi:glycosyltransferase involved in cell wall biosynthesis